MFTGYDGIFFVCAKKSTVYFVNFLIFGEISAYYSEMGVFIVFFAQFDLGKQKMPTGEKPVGICAFMKIGLFASADSRRRQRDSPEYCRDSRGFGNSG